MYLIRRIPVLGMFSFIFVLLFYSLSWPAQKSFEVQRLSPLNETAVSRGADSDLFTSVSRIAILAEYPLELSSQSSPIDAARLALLDCQ